MLCTYVDLYDSSVIEVMYDGVVVAVVHNKNGCALIDIVATINNISVSEFVDVIAKARARV